MAITGELVASRKVPAEARAEIQREIIEVLKDLNTANKSELLRPAVLTAGDGIQALFVIASTIVKFISDLTDHLPGLRAAKHGIVFGVGAGSLSTGDLTEATGVEHLSGTCFHEARGALTKAKKSKTWAVFQGFGEGNDPTLTSLFELMGAIRSGWTDKQLEYTLDQRKLNKRIEVAKLHGVSPSVITESLQQSRYDAVRHGELAAHKILHHQFDLRG